MAPFVCSCWRRLIEKWVLKNAPLRTEASHGLVGPVETLGAQHASSGEEGKTKRSITSGKGAPSHRGKARNKMIPEARTLNENNVKRYSSVSRRHSKSRAQKSNNKARNNPNPPAVALGRVPARNRKQKTESNGKRTTGEGGKKPLQKVPATHSDPPRTAAPKARNAADQAKQEKRESGGGSGADNVRHNRPKTGGRRSQSRNGHSSNRKSDPASEPSKVRTQTARPKNAREPGVSVSKRHVPYKPLPPVTYYFDNEEGEQYAYLRDEHAYTLYHCRPQRHSSESQLSLNRHQAKELVKLEKSSGPKKVEKKLSKK